MYRLRTQYPDPKYQLTFSTTCRINHSSRRHIVSIILTHLSLLRPFCPQTRHPHLAPSNRALDARKPTPKYWRVTHTDGHFGDLSEHHVCRSRTSAQQLSLMELVRSLCEARVRTFRCAGCTAPLFDVATLWSRFVSVWKSSTYLCFTFCVFTRRSPAPSSTQNTRLLSAAPQDRGRPTLRPALLVASCIGRFVSFGLQWSIGTPNRESRQGETTRGQPGIKTAAGYAGERGKSVKVTQHKGL